ncbi:MAG: ParB N-terminal domain-containing protein [Alkalispirochaetaceae bacterium]
MQIDVNAVILRRRVRKNLGDLKPLAESLKTHGLINPILINERNELIAGHRRLEAAKLLGWNTIAARVVDRSEASELLEMEVEENTHRKALTADELAEAYDRLEHLKNPGFFTRLWRSIRRFFAKLFGKQR